MIEKRGAIRDNIEERGEQIEERGETREDNMI
jgi:hypothetical protein